MKTQAEQKTDDAKALLKLKKWLKKKGRQNAEYLLSLALPDDSPFITLDLKLTIARAMISCIEDYELADFWKGGEGSYYFVEYIEGLDDFGRELDEDDRYPYPAPVEVRHPYGDRNPDNDIRDGLDSGPADAVFDYLYGKVSLIVDDEIYASNTREEHKRHMAEFNFAPNFCVLNELVAGAGRKVDDAYRFLTESVSGGRSGDK